MERDPSAGRYAEYIAGDMEHDPSAEPYAENVAPIGSPPRNLRYGPMMNCAKFMNLFDTLISQRRITFIAPVFWNKYASPASRSNPNYLALVASLCVPLTLGHTERSTKIAIQAHAVGYSDADCCDTATAKETVMRGIRDIWNNLPQDIRDAYTDEQGPAAWITDGNVPIPDNDIQHLLESLSALPTQIATTLSIFTTALLAYCKQGVVTPNVLMKVRNTARDELSVNLVLDPDIIRSFWDYVGHWCTPDNARSFFEMCERTAGEMNRDCSMFKHLIQQTRWRSMTNFTNILKAKEQYPDFPWEKCVQMFPEDFKNYAAAVVAVGNDEYYGYNKDLGVARSTLYPSLSYVAYELLTNISGDRRLKDFLGRKRSAKCAVFIDRLVQEYKMAKRASMTTEYRAAEIQRSKEFLAQHQVNG